MTGTIDVRTQIPVHLYRQLLAVAEHHHTTVGALVAELTRRGLTQPKIGRPSKYTPELGERILEARWMRRSWKQIAADEHLANETVRRYAAQAEAEARAAIARNSTNHTKERAA